MGNLVVVEGAQVKITSGEGAAKIETPASQTVKINNKGVYRGNLTISINGYSGTGFTNGSGTGTIQANALYTNFDGQKAVLLGANATFSITAQTTTTPPSPITVPCTVQIIDAGQSEVRTE